MKSKIQTTYPLSVFQSISAETIYVADFTERTNSARKVEIHAAVPCVPDSIEAMDCLKMNNRDKVELEFCLFDDHQFKDEQGKDISHCECCFFPSSNDERSYIAFIEIKDCKAKNISKHKDKVKEQISSTIQLFKTKAIIEKQKLYGIISFPRRKKMLFNDFPYKDIYETTRWVKDYGIHLIASNEIYIKDNKTISEQA